MRVFLSLALLLLIAACTSTTKPDDGDNQACAGNSACEETAKPEPAKPKPEKTDLQIMQDRIAEVSARNEVDVDTIEVQHLLVAVKNPRIPKVKRTDAESMELAAELYVRITNGEDFDALIKEYTDDSPPGIYGITTNKSNVKAGVYPRSGMVSAFGDVGWKLEVGEVSVAPFDKKSSPFGYHVIKRLK
ncbi:MAG: peptidyl-prolyl cis-trans isomerase [Planctomycetes bacterium]|nr:peptidyl-prolyl cis-trans isomerase [Planctomycetota bacterium]